MLGGQQRVGDFLSGSRTAQLLRQGAAATLVVAAAAWLAGCGSNADSRDEVAQPVTPPPLPAQKATDAPAVQAGPDRDEADRARAHATRARGGILSSNDRASFTRLSTALGGEQGIAVSAIGFGRRVERTGPLQAGVAWSTSKVPVAMAVIARGGAEAHRRDLTQAITASDNAAALRLWSTLGDGQAAALAAEEQVRQAGDAHTQIEARLLRGAQYTPFGQTRWTLGDQTRFTAGLACLEAGAQVLGLMNQVVPGQRWGLGAAGVEAQFKGGWGPGSEPGVGGGDFDRQMGVVTIAGMPLAVAIAARPADGSHNSGTQNLTTIARWLVAHANVRGIPQRARC
jgi:hypothetical protein